MSARPDAPGRLGAARAADLLLAGALAIAAAGAALVVVRPAPRVPEAPPAVPPPPPAPAAAAAPLGEPALQEAVVRTNVFAATRTPPRVRYLPPDAAAAAGMPDAPGLAPRAEPAAAPAPPRGPDDPPQFYGTIIGPDGPRALLRLDARVPGAQLYAAGEGARGWRVERVEPERVVLTVAGERVTLRLPRPGSRRAADSVPRVAPDSSEPTSPHAPPT